jgi:putative restriction endonuclease
MQRRNWTRDELIVAFNLYCKLPFGQLHAKNPRVVELARVLGRTPGSVAMKLVNFAALDSTHRQRGVSGLANTSKADRQVWDEFNGNWADLVAESEKAHLALTGKDLALSAPEDAADVPGSGETERQQMVKVRLGQSFFRETVLASYGSRCCVCVLPVAPLLVASHIVPWAARPDLRVNPRNGLCLCALHDRAFDRGLITIDGALKVSVSRRLVAHLPDDVIDKMFMAYRGHPIRLPEKFRPQEEFLAYHREAVFVPA